MADFFNPSLVGAGTALGLFVGILAFLALGRRLGLRARSRGGDAGAAGGESLEAAVFALLGLLIAFTFSGALSRFDVRRTQVVDEANAIGTAYLRADLLPAAEQPRLRDLMRRYADARIATYRALPDIDASRAELARSQALQTEIWTHAVAALRLPDGAPGASVLVVPALNEMFDLATARTAATLMHPPLVVYLMLVGLALVSALLAGYHAPTAGAALRLHQLGFAAIVAFTVYVILDMEYPRLGWIRLDAIDQVLAGARAAMK
jgi:hypothetical protein